MPTLRNVAIDPATGGYLFVGGKRQFVYDKPAIQQAIRTRLRTIMGEWFLDRTLGVPYFQAILVKGADPRGIQSILSAEIAAVQGVSAVVSVNLAYDKKKRALAAAYQVQTDAGLLTDTISTTG